MNLTSPAFSHNSQIPKKYTCEDENISPPLQWSDIPGGVHSFALICDDPDAPQAEPWVHWIVYNIPADINHLPEKCDLSSIDAIGGLNDFKKTTYGGPCPPKNHGIHHYHFTLYALREVLPMHKGLTKNELLRLIERLIFAKAELVGIYQR